MNKTVITNPETQIKFMCHNIFITINNIAVNQNFNVLKERLNNQSSGYTVNGTFRTKKWIKENCVNVLGFVTF